MIISHQHQYLFVEIPHTASTAISHELCENYAGIPILEKHTPYHEFLKRAGAQEKKYFAFAGVRNPLDIAVTVYFKRKTNHQGFFTDEQRWQRHGGHVSDTALRRYDFIRSNAADFPTYFKKFHKIPYDNWGAPSPQDFDFIIRFENLEDDFGRLLELLGIRQVRPLPVVNKTSQRERDFHSYYTPDIYDQALGVFGPFLKKWRYDFPTEWANSRVPWSSQMLFNALRIYRRHSAHNRSPHILLLKRLRGMWDI